jgi:KaiC/GvpD/RAD55 family RecA-like ATPase
MFKDSVEGLDRVFKTDIEKPKVILVTGPPGSMKTSFCFSLMTKYLQSTGEFGIYTTLEETAESHVKNMGSLGIKMTSNLKISDVTELREIDLAVGESENPDYVHFIEKAISHLKKKHEEKFSIFTIDSLGALYSLMEDVSNMRKRMFYFFKMLRDNNLFSLVVMERAIGGDSQLLGNEGFLVDGIIEMGLERSRGKLFRYVQVEKMRACQHSMEKHAIEIGKDGMKVLGPIFESTQ